MTRVLVCRRFHALLEASYFLILCLMTVGGDASAHHGFGGRYDLSRPVWIEGVVKQVHFGQPHAEITVEVPADIQLPRTAPDLASAASFLDGSALTVRADTAGRVVKIELPPTQQFFRLGNVVVVGATIAVVAVRNCEAPHQLNGQWLRLASGEIVARSGAMSYMVKGC
jgi:hypothetical protein